MGISRGSNAVYPVDTQDCHGTSCLAMTFIQVCVLTLLEIATAAAPLRNDIPSGLLFYHTLLDLNGLTQFCKSFGFAAGDKHLPSVDLI